MHAWPVVKPAAVGAAAVYGGGDWVFLAEEGGLSACLRKREKTERLSIDDRWFLLKKMRRMGESARVDPLFSTWRPVKETLRGSSASLHSFLSTGDKWRHSTALWLPLIMFQVSFDEMANLGGNGCALPPEVEGAETPNALPRQRD